MNSSMVSLRLCINDANSEMQSLPCSMCSCSYADAGTITCLCPHTWCIAPGPSCFLMPDLTAVLNLCGYGSGCSFS